MQARADSRGVSGRHWKPSNTSYISCRMPCVPNGELFIHSKDNAQSIAADTAAAAELPPVHHFADMALAALFFEFAVFLSIGFSPFSEHVPVRVVGLLCPFHRFDGTRSRKFMCQCNKHRKCRTKDDNRVLSVQDRSQDEWVA